MKHTPNLFSKPSDEVIHRYTLALGIAISFGPTPGHHLDKPAVLFLAGPLIKGGTREFLEMARDKCMDVVCLEFEPGRSRKGPKNISVYEHTGNEVRAWPRCSLWARGKGDLFVIIPKGEDFGFGYAGERLWRMTGAPTSRLAEGFALARTELRRYATRMPLDEMVHLSVSKPH